MADATLPQLKRFLELLDREPDSKQAMQRLLENGGAVQMIMRGEVNQATLVAALQHIDSMQGVYGLFGRSPRSDNLYKGEFVEPAYFYPSGYAVNSPDQQLDLLRAAFPGVTLEIGDLAGKIRGLGAAPTGVDGPYPYLRVRRSKLAQLANMHNVDREHFGLVLEQTTLAALGRREVRFTNYRSGQMGPEYFRVREHTWDTWDRLETEQSEGDILVAWGQSGRLGAGCSMRLCRHEIGYAVEPTQWEWSALEGSLCLLTNPHRLSKYEDLIIDCPGEEYSSEAGDQFGGALYFRFDGGELYCGSRWTGRASGYCGSASGFLR